MLSSPRRPSNTMRIFSSAEYCLRVARRMSWTTFSAGSFDDRVCCLIFAPVNVTMSQKLSLLQSANSVSWALMADIRDILGLHRRTELPGDDVAREVVEDCRQIKPAPADDLEVGEVGLPELIGCGSLILEFVGCLDHDEGRTRNQVVRLEQSIHRGFRDKIAFGIGEACGEFARRQLRHVQSHRDDAFAHLVGDAIPDPIRLRRFVFECLRPAGLEARIPSVECRGQDADCLQRPSRRQVGLLDQADDLELFGSRNSHSSSPPSPIMLFLSSRNSSACSATTSFNSWAWRLRSLTSLLVAARAVSPANRRLPASRNSFDQL